MKFFWFFTAFFFLNPSVSKSFQNFSAQNCPNISGVFKESIAVYRKIIQTDCVTLKYQFGIPIPLNGIKWLEPAIELYLDGRTICHAGTCTTGIADTEKLHFSLDVPGRVKTSDHKYCEFTEQDYLKPTNESVTRIIYATKCEDGHSGPVKIVLKKEVISEN
jgi:hypothetical protein